jgi:hypothetical protein
MPYGERQDIDLRKYMPSEALPVDTGGLGYVACEPLDAARDLGVCGSPRRR